MSFSLNAKVKNMANIIQEIEKARMTRKVPEVLQGGHHADIQRWRLKQAVARTWLRRPDLIARGGLSADATALLDEFLAEREGDEHG